MEIFTFYAEGLSHYSYAIVTSAGIVVIDPKRDVDEYIELAKGFGLPIRYVLLTHSHADFIGGQVRLSELTGAEILAGKGMDAGYECRELEDGERIDLGEVSLRVMVTPGHTPEHVSYLLYDKSVTEKVPLAVFTGDSLFAGDVGRPDLFGPGMQEELTKRLYETVERYKGLPDSVLVYPAHGAGSFCGKRISNRCPTTIGYEKLTNELFSVEDYERFKSLLFANMPTPPAYYFTVSKRNRTGEGLDRGLKLLTGVKVKELVSFKGTVVDTRDQACFAAMFIPNSLNIASDVHFAVGAGFVLSVDEEIVLVGDELDRVYLTLYRMGYDNVKGYLYGGIEAWRNAALPVESFGYVDPKTAYDLISSGDAVIVDVRSESEFVGEHIPDAVNVPLAKIKDALAEIPADKLVICQCGHGCRGSLAASILKRRGFDKVANMAGGLIAWKARGLPVDSK